MASLKEQLQWCVNTQDYLNQLVLELVKVSKEYNKCVDDLEQEGLIEEYLRKIREISLEFQTDVVKVVNYIQEDHQVYIQSQINQISSKL